MVFYTILITLGLISFSRLNYELIPDISPPLITVATIYPGASPGEIENAVTKKIEDATFLTGTDHQDAVKFTGKFFPSLLSISRTA